MSLTPTVDQIKLFHGKGIYCCWKLVHLMWKLATKARVKNWIVQWSVRTVMIF